MIFTLLVTYSDDMKSNRPQPTRDDIGLPLLRKSISEPRLLTDVHHRFERQNHRHISSATPRILTANGPSSQRHSAVRKPAEESQPPQNDVPTVAADRSIDMINPLNFPVVMTKNFLRRRANTADIHAHSETLNADRKNGGLRVTNGKYGSPAGSGAEHSDRARGILKRREQGSSRNGWQPFEDEHQMRNGVTLPGVSSWRKAEGSSVLAALPGNKSDLQRGRSSAASSCSWQTYPLSSRPFSTHRGSKYLRADQRVMPTNGFIPQSNDGHSANTNTRIRTRFATPGQREHVTLSSSNHERSDPNNAKQLPADETSVVCVSKPTTEFLQRKRATTANGLQKNANDSVDEVLESVVDEDENRNFRVRDWLSSLDSTLCQRYARRQMASLREYELTNQKT